jgi:hypothetical protein
MGLSGAKYVVAGMLLLGMVGCKSAFINADVRNATGGTVTLVEVDYPNASFGRESLAAGADFRYGFKVLGSGGTTVSWTDAANTQHTMKGPDLHELQEGSLTITLEPATATWAAQLRDR